MTLARPLEIYWSLTRGCNLACTFCFTSSDPGTFEGDLPPEDRLRVRREILAAGPLRVTMSGGEPLAVPDTLDHVAAFRAAGIAVKVTTNGTLLREPVLAELAALGVRLQFSIEAVDPDVNDRLMGGEGTVARILGGLERARAAGIPCEAKITLCRDNVDHLADLLDALHARGVEKISVSEVLPLGRAVERWAELQVDHDALVRAGEASARAHRRGVPVEFGATQVTARISGIPTLCSLGEPRPSAILVDERGEVRSCTASQGFAWTNNVLDGGLMAAWDRLTELGRFRDPEMLEGECRTCDMVDTCKGGCRGSAVQAWGHLRGPDPYCPRLGAAEGRTFFGRKVAPVALVFPDGTTVRPGG